MTKKNLFAVIAVFLAIYIFFYRTGKKLTEEVAGEFNSKIEKVGISEVPHTLAPANPIIQEPRNLGRIGPIEIEKIREVSKSTLASIYTAESSYFAEWNRFTTDLKAAGFSNSTRILNTKFGFMHPFRTEDLSEESTGNEVPDRTTSDFLLEEIDSQSNERFVYSEQLANLDLSQFEKYCENGCTASSEGFELILVALLGDEKNFDVWLINSKKEIKLIHDGVLKQ